MSENKTNSFVKGAAILAAAGILVKILGAIYRIPLGNLVGPEGMGYYQSAYPIYTFLLVISTAGVPTAIAKIISEKHTIGDHYGKQKVLRTAFMLMAIIGFVSMLIMSLGAPIIVKVIKNPNSLYSIMALSPALLFVSIMSVFRGYFQGIQRMEPYAISQIIEQLFRVIIGMGLVVLLLSKGPQFSAAGATFGASAGAVFGFLIIFFMYMRYKKKNNLSEIKKDEAFEQESSKSIVKNILMIAIPITIGASILPIMQMIDLFVVLRRLVDIGYTTAEANEMYGMLTGYAASIVNLPQIITAAIQISIVPAVASLLIVGNRERLNNVIETGMRLALIIGLPCGVGMVVMAEQIMILLYPMQMEIASQTGAILSILGWGVIFLSLYQVTTGILQGVGKQMLPARNLMIAACFKVVLSYVLVGIPMLNIRGAAISTVTTFGIAAFLNFMTVLMHTKVKVHYKDVFFKPIIDAFVMGAAVLLSYNLLLSFVGVRIATIIAIGVGVLTYVLMLFVTNTITEEDLALMPGGTKIRKVMDRFYRKSE